MKRLVVFDEQGGEISQVIEYEGNANIKILGFANLDLTEAKEDEWEDIRKNPKKYKLVRKEGKNYLAKHKREDIQ